MNPIYDKKRKINEPEQQHQQQQLKRPSWRNTSMEHDSSYSNISSFNTSTPNNSWDYHNNNNRGYNNSSSQYEQHLNHNPNLFHSNRSYNENNNSYEINDYPPRSSYETGAYYNQLDHNRNSYDNYYPVPLQPPVTPFYTSTLNSNKTICHHRNDNRSANNLSGRYNDYYYASSNIATNNTMLGSTYNDHPPFNIPDPFYEPPIYNRYNNPTNINRNSLTTKMIIANAHKTRQYSFGNKKANKDLTSIKSPSSSIKSTSQSIVQESPIEIEKPKVIQSVAIKDYLNMNMALLDYHISVSLLKLGIKYEKKTESFLVLESITKASAGNIVLTTENKSSVKGKTSTSTITSETKTKSQPIQVKNLDSDVNNISIKNNSSNNNNKLPKQQLSITKPPLPSATKRTPSVPILQNKGAAILLDNESSSRQQQQQQQQKPFSISKTLQSPPLSSSSTHKPPQPPQNQPHTLPPPPILTATTIAAGTMKRTQSETIYLSQSTIKPGQLLSSSSSLNINNKQLRGISPTRSQTSTDWSGLKTTISGRSRSNNSKDRDNIRNNNNSNYNYNEYYDHYDNRYSNNYMYIGRGGSDYSNFPPVVSIDSRGGYIEHDSYYNHNNSDDCHNNGYNHQYNPYINLPLRNNDTNRVDYNYDYTPSYNNHDHPILSYRSRSPPQPHIQQQHYMNTSNNNNNNNNNNLNSNPNLYHNNTPKIIEKRIDHGINNNIQSNNKSKKSSPGISDISTKPPLPPAILKTPR